MNKAYILIVLLAFNYPLLAQSHFRYQDREVLLKPEGTFYVIHTDNLSTESHSSHVLESKRLLQKVQET